MRIRVIGVHARTPLWGDEKGGNRFSHRITMLNTMKTTPQAPSDFFTVRDTITVVGSSKHHGRLATV
jgi:hypothetical protein